MDTRFFPRQNFPIFPDYKLFFPLFELNIFIDQKKLLKI